MKFSTENVLAGLALLALGFAIGKRAAASNTRGAVVPSDAGSPAEWWTYAGQWRM